MDIPLFLSKLNYVLSLPTTFLFIGTAIALTLQTKFIQIRAFPRFLYLITGKNHLKEQTQTKEKTLSPIKALFLSKLNYVLPLP